jgi:selenocysteine lyase/cysteine desulfurase
MDEINRKLLMYGSIGRGFSQKSNYSTELYEETRGTVLSFVGLDPSNDYDYTCFYVNNTTDGLNKLASALITDKEDLVLSTRMEHHANDLSWRERCRVIYAEVDDLGRVRYDEIERLLQENRMPSKASRLTFRPLTLKVSFRRSIHPARMATEIP